MKTTTRKISMIALGAVIVLVVAVVGYSLGQSATTGVESLVQTQTASPAAEPSMSFDASLSEESKLGYSDDGGSAQRGSAPDGVENAQAPSASERLVIRTANMELRVESVDTALTGLKAAAESAGAEIADLSVVSGEPNVLAYDQANPDGASRGPATAYVTLRVAAEKLDALESRIAGLGTLISQSSNANDVTEQAIDLEARLKNLRAEEVRLRAFLNKTAKVSELLEVQRELSRVRGEIEAMDAQLTYLQRQAARSTLTVMLSEPGPVVQPAGATWGLREAITRGIQATATLITTLVTIAIPLAVVAALIGLIAWPIRAITRRRRSRTAHEAGDSNPVEQDEE